MRAAAIALALLFTPAAAGAQASATQDAASPVPVYGYEVVRVWPHDRTAFTQGLAWHDGHLLESTGRYPSTVRRVRLEDGAVLDIEVLDTAWFGEGLTEIGGRVVTLTWQAGTGFIWDAEDLSPEGEFAYAGEGWGLTDDGNRLILSDGTAALRFFDARTLTETGRVPVTLQGRPVSQINELEWIDGEVFANVWRSDAIVRIDPADDVLNGIAWDPDGRRLFVTGKNWPSLFEIRLTGPR